MAVLQQITVPLLSVNDTSLTVVDVSFPNAAFVKKGQTIMVFETSKTTYNVEAETDGYIQYLCEEGNDYDVNDVVANIFSEESEVPKAIRVKTVELKPVQEVAHATPVAAWEGDTLFSASAVSLLESSGMDRLIFKGKDFVSREDVENILGGRNKEIVTEPLKSKPAKPKLAVPVDAEQVTVEKLSSNKRREIEYLGEVQSAGLTSTINTGVETEGIFVHVNQSLKMMKNSLLPVIIYETARLLEKYRDLNGYFTGDGIASYKKVDIGFAIDIDKGLKVLKIPDTSRKSINEIEDAIMTLSGKYIDDTLEINDLTGISFTITDLSSEGVAFFRPLINMMNSAILGISAIDEKLNRCILSVTFDHRVTEGKRVAQFLKELKDRLESYRSKFHPHLNQDITCFKCFKSLKDDLSDVGFARCITPNGEESYICQSCLQGF